MEFKTLTSEVIYDGRVFDIRHERVSYPDGRVAELDILRHGGAVTIVPVDGEGQIWFVRQYRHGAGGLMLELPAGTLSENEPPQVCAEREIREEIGMAAGQMEGIGEFYLAPGYSTEYMYVYLATGLRPDPLQKDADEFLTPEAYSVRQAYAMLRENRLRDAKTVAALALAEPVLVEKGII